SASSDYHTFSIGWATRPDGTFLASPWRETAGEQVMNAYRAFRALAAALVAAALSSAPVHAPRPDPEVAAAPGAQRVATWNPKGDSGSRNGALSRIKDLANIEGVRQNQLIGYGLVVGLNGTGDSLNNTPFTKQSLQAMLERLGVNIRGAALRTGN